MASVERQESGSELVMTPGYASTGTVHWQGEVDRAAAMACGDFTPLSFELFIGHLLPFASCRATWVRGGDCRGTRLRCRHGVTAGVTSSRACRTPACGAG